MGPGLLRHDQHRHLRARARGAAAHPDRPAVRLLEGAVPAAARDGAADVRLRLRRLLAGHRQPRPVPAGELRRARREGRARHLRASRSRGDVWVGEGVEIDDVEGVEGPAFIGNYCTISPRVVGRAVLGARAGHDAARARRASARSVIDASLLHRPQRARRGRDPRPQLRRARARARARGRRDRRPGDARRPVRRLPGRADLPVQGGRVRRADPREPDLGVARHDAPVRQGRRARPRQRRPDARGRDPLRRGARHGAEARRACRREPRERAGVPDDQARDHLRPATRPASGRRPADAARAGRQAPPEDAGLRRRRSTSARPSHDPEAVQIRLFERPGIALSAAMQKEIEKHFTRQELRRVPFADVGGDHVSRRVRARRTRATCSAGSTSTRSASAGSGSSSTTATRRPAGCCRSCSGRSGSRR